MSLALVGDRKSTWPQNLCSNYSSWNVLSLHSSSFIIILFEKDIAEWYYGQGELRGDWPLNWHSWQLHCCL